MCTSYTFRIREFYLCNGGKIDGDRPSLREDRETAKFLDRVQSLVKNYHDGSAGEKDASKRTRRCEKAKKE